MREEKGLKKGKKYIKKGRNNGLKNGKKRKKFSGIREVFPPLIKAKKEI